jgi:hypothetical protein
MQWARTALVGLTLCYGALSALPGHVAAQDVPRYHACYLATAHIPPASGHPDFDLSVCRADDNEAIDEAITLAVAIAGGCPLGGSRYVENVTVVYQP